MNPTDTKTNTNPGATSTIPGAGATNTSSLMNEIQKQLLNQSGIVSSTTSNLEQKLQSAISGVNNSTEFSNKALQSEFERNAGYLGDKFNQDQQSGRAAGSGGIMNWSAMKSLVDSTDKSLKDLAQRKEELTMQNNAVGAAKVADLEIKALEFKQQAAQQFYSNLFQLGDFSLKAQAEQRQVEENKQKAVENVGKLITDNPQAGILVTDTPEQAYAKIGVNPNSPDTLYKKAQIDNIYNEIKNRNIAAGKSTASAGTQAERQASILAGYASAFVQGATMTGGVPTVDENGFATPAAWKAAINEAKVPRKDFIEQFGYLLSPFDSGSKKKSENGVANAYGLTPQELKLIQGS